MQIHLQTHLLSSRNPEDLATHAINLPFDDSTSFDGTGVVNDTDKRRKIKVEKFVATLIDANFFYNLLRLEFFRQVKQEYYQEEIYSPWKVLRVMDKKGRHF
jgi:hypothetical protein